MNILKILNNKNQVKITSQKYINYILFLILVTSIIFNVINKKTDLVVFLILVVVLIIISLFLRISVRVIASMGIVLIFVGSFFLMFQFVLLGEYFLSLAYLSLITIFGVILSEKLFIEVIESHKVTNSKLTLRPEIAQIYTFFEKIYRLIVKIIVNNYWGIRSIMLYTILIYISVICVKEVFIAWNIYQNFQPDNNFKFFFQQTGQFLLLSNVITLIIGLLIFYGFKIKLRPLILIILVSVNFLITHKITDSTTKFRDEIMIWDIKPSRVTLWDQVTIDGRNFGDKPFIGKIYVSWIEHRIISWTDHQVIFQIEPNKTKSGKIILETYNGKISNQVELEVYDITTKQKI